MESISLPPSETWVVVAVWEPHAAHQKTEAEARRLGFGAFPGARPDTLTHGWMWVVVPAEVAGNWGKVLRPASPRDLERAGLE